MRARDRGRHAAKDCRSYLNPGRCRKDSAFHMGHALPTELTVPLFGDFELIQTVKRLPKLTLQHPKTERKLEKWKL